MCLRLTCRAASGLRSNRGKSPQLSVRPPLAIVVAVTAVVVVAAAAGAVRAAVWLPVRIASGRFLFLLFAAGGDANSSSSSPSSSPSAEQQQQQQQEDPQRGSSGVLQSVRELTRRSISNVTQVVRSGSSNSNSPGTAEGGSVLDKARESLSSVRCFALLLLLVLLLLLLLLLLATQSVLLLLVLLRKLLLLMARPLEQHVATLRCKEVHYICCCC